MVVHMKKESKDQVYKLKPLLSLNKAIETVLLNQQGSDREVWYDSLFKQAKDLNYVIKRAEFQEEKCNEEELILEEEDDSEDEQSALPETQNLLSLTKPINQMG